MPKGFSPASSFSSPNQLPLPSSRWWSSNIAQFGRLFLISSYDSRILQPLSQLLLRTLAGHAVRTLQLELTVRRQLSRKVPSPICSRCAHYLTATCTQQWLPFRFQWHPWFLSQVLNHFDWLHQLILHFSNRMWAIMPSSYSWRSSKNK